MTSTIHADKIMNSSGDQDSGLDLLVNDQVKIKTANTDRVTVTNSSVAVSGDLNVDSGVLSVTASDNKIRYTQGTNKGLVIQDAGIADSVEINFGTSANGIRAGLLTGSNLSFYTGTAGGGTASKKMEIDTAGRVLKPAQPGFMIGLSSGNHTSIGNFIFNNVYFNEGNHYNTSTGAFTAPVAGVYQFNAFCLLNNNLALGTYYWEYRYNNVTLAYCYEPNLVASKHRMYQLSICYKMNANDTMSVYNHSGHWYGIAAQHSQFSGYLLG